MQEKGGGVRGHGFVSHTPEREPWCQLAKRDLVKKEIFMLRQVLRPGWSWGTQRLPFIRMN